MRAYFHTSKDQNRIYFLPRHIYFNLDYKFHSLTTDWFAVPIVNKGFKKTPNECASVCRAYPFFTYGRVGSLSEEACMCGNRRTKNDGADFICIRNDYCANTNTLNLYKIQAGTNTFYFVNLEIITLWTRKTSTPWICKTQLKNVYVQSMKVLNSKSVKVLHILSLIISKVWWGKCEKEPLQGHL